MWLEKCREGGKEVGKWGEKRFLAIGKGHLPTS